MEILFLALFGFVSCSLGRSFEGGQLLPKSLEAKISIPKAQMTNVENVIDRQSYYLVKVKIGSNEQEFNLIVDTGSTASWVVNVTCPNCTLKPKNTYNPSKSKNSTILSVNNRVTYEDGSYVQGMMYADIFQIAGLKAMATFLCVNTTSMHWEGFKADGVLGLGYEQFTRGYPPIIKALRAANLINSTQFSLFYTDATFLNRIKPAMTIGSPDYSTYANKTYLKYLGVANNINTGNFLWTIYATNILMGNVTVGSLRQVVLDSAQPWIFVGASDYLNVEAILKANNFTYSNFTYSSPCKSSAGFPSLFIEVNNTFDLEIPSYRYLSIYKNKSSKTGKTCYATLSKSNDDHWYVGDSLFRTYYTVFNYDNSSIIFTTSSWEPTIEVITKHHHHHDDDDDDGLAGWAIALIVIACVVAVAAIGALVYFYLKKRDRNSHYDSTGKPLQEVSLHA